MSVPDGQIVQYHVEGRVEDGPISLRLPELDIKSVFIITYPSIGFPDLSHMCLHFLHNQQR